MFAVSLSASALCAPFFAARIGASAYGGGNPDINDLLLVESLCIDGSSMSCGVEAARS